MKKINIIVLISLFAPYLYGAELKIEPVYGVERTYRLTPEPARYNTEIFAGIRGVYGTPTLAGELEITQTNSSIAVGDTETRTNTQKLLLGMRLVPLQGSFFSLYLRGGMRAKKVTQELSNDELTTNNIKLDPYAGTGLSLNLGGLISLNTSATLVFNQDAASSEQYDTRYTFSVSFKFGSSST